MADDKPDGWGTRLLLFLMALLLFSGLLILAVKLFHDTAAPAR